MHKGRGLRLGEGIVHDLALVEFRATGPEICAEATLFQLKARVILELFRVITHRPQFDDTVGLCERERRGGRKRERQREGQRRERESKRNCLNSETTMGREKGRAREMIRAKCHVSPSHRAAVIHTFTLGMPGSAFNLASLWIWLTNWKVPAGGKAKQEEKRGKLNIGPSGSGISRQHQNLARTGRSHCTATACHGRDALWSQVKCSGFCG